MLATTMSSLWIRSSLRPRSAHDHGPARRADSFHLGKLGLMMAWILAARAQIRDIRRSRALACRPRRKSRRARRGHTLLRRSEKLGLFIDSRVVSVLLIDAMARSSISLDHCGDGPAPANLSTIRCRVSCGSRRGADHAIISSRYWPHRRSAKTTQDLAGPRALVSRYLVRRVTTYSAEGDEQRQQAFRVIVLRGRPLSSAIILAANRLAAA